MRSLVVLSVLALALSQSPVPLPNLNLNNFAGKWYVVWEYGQDINNQIPNPVGCNTWNVNVEDSTNVAIDMEFSLEGSNYSDSEEFIVENNGNSFWVGNQGLLNLTWVAVDPISFSWAAAGTQNQGAFIIARNANLSNLLINAQVALLSGEGYNINGTNVYSFTNNC